MGIPIGGGGRRGRRRSYADYRPSNRRQRPRSDPFRVVFYLVLIAGGIWVYLNPDVLRGQFESLSLGSQTQPGEEPVGPPSDAATADTVDYAAQAEDFYSQGQLEEAINTYQQAGVSDPTVVEYPFQEARLLLYSSSMEYGDRRDAILQLALDAANRAILANLEDPRGYAILGKIKDWQGKPEEALNDIQRALELQKDLPIANSYLAEALVDLNRWDQAQTTIEYAYSLDPNNVDVRRDYAYVMESLGDYVSAAAQYEAAVQLEPNLPSIRMALGRAYRVNGRFTEALDQFFSVETLFPTNALVPYEIGRTYETYVGDPTSAIESYERAVELDQDFAAPWVRLGVLYYDQGNYPQAALAFEQAVALGVDSVDVYLQLGLAHANVGECAKAMQPLQTARSMSPDDERVTDLVNSALELCSLPTPTPGPPASPTP